MAWIELHQAIRDHRKIVALADVLDMPEPHVIGHLACMWLWSLDNAPDGTLPSSNRIVARAAQWTGSPDDWANALIEVGLIDCDGDVRCIHDWHDYAGKLIERREANTQRMRSKRAQNVQRTCDECAPATVPYSTVPNPTEQNQTEPPCIPPTPETPVPPDGGKPKTKRAAQIPEDWEPDDKGREFARSRGIQDAAVGVEVQHFRDFHRAKGNTFVDVAAAWRTWCTNHSKWASGRAPIPIRAPNRVTPDDLDRFAEELKRETGLA